MRFSIVIGLSLATISVVVALPINDLESPDILGGLKNVETKVVPQADALGQAAKPLPPNQKASLSIKIQTNNARTPSAGKALPTEKTPSTHKTLSIPKSPSIPKTPKTRLGEGGRRGRLGGIHVQKGEHSRLGGELAPRGIFRTPRRGSDDRCDEDGRLAGTTEYLARHQGLAVDK